MFPEEIQDAMAKILLFVFATVMICFSRARADEIQLTPSPSVKITYSIVK
jgi:hypothetical protein